MKKTEFGKTTALMINFLGNGKNVINCQTHCHKTFVSSNKNIAKFGFNIHILKWVYLCNKAMIKRPYNSHHRSCHSAVF